MTEERTITRRTVVKSSLAATATVGLAGCSDALDSVLGGGFDEEVTKENPRQIHVGQTVHATLQTDDGRDPHYDDVAEPVELQLGASTRVRIDMHSTDFDAFLLLSRNGETLAQNDDGPTSTDSRLTQQLGSGTYTIWAGSLSGDATGEYTLEVSEASATDVGSGDTGGSNDRVDDGGGIGDSGGSGDGGASGTVDAETIQVGESVQAELTADAALDPEYGDLADPYRFTVDSGTRLRISQSSPDFDTYLLVTQNGATVAENDDGPTSTDSEIISDFEPGTYTIWAGSLSGSATGAYTLSLESPS